jgi:hypothetical protein
MLIYDYHKNAHSSTLFKKHDTTAKSAPSRLSDLAGDSGGTTVRVLNPGYLAHKIGTPNSA